MFSFFRIQDETNWDIDDGWIDGDGVSWRSEIPGQLRYLVNQLAALIFNESEDNFTQSQLDLYARHAESLLNLIIPFVSAMSFNKNEVGRWLSFGSGNEIDRASFAQNTPPVYLTKVTLDELDNFNLVSLITELVECSTYHDQGCISPNWLKIEDQASLPPIKNAGAILAAYGLYKLDKSLLRDDENDLFRAVCIAGQLMGAAALRIGWDEGGSLTKSENSRKGLEIRWSALNDVKAEIQQKYTLSGITNKAAFIRKIRSSVLDDPRLVGYGLIESNIDRTVRKWLSGHKS